MHRLSTRFPRRRAFASPRRVVAALLASSNLSPRARSRPVHPRSRVARDRASRRVTDRSRAPERRPSARADRVARHARRWNFEIFARFDAHRARAREERGERLRGRARVGDSPPRGGGRRQASSERARHLAMVAVALCR